MGSCRCDTCHKPEWECDCVIMLGPAFEMMKRAWLVVRNHMPDGADGSLHRAFETIDAALFANEHCQLPRTTDVTEIGDDTCR